MAWVDRHASYLAACRRIAAELRRSPEGSTFKVHPDYAAVVGNDTRNRATTAAFLKAALKTRTAKAVAARVAANDRYGAPRRHEIAGRKWSAGSLRFLQVADEIGDAPAVVEIGGGYGGQRLLCASVSDYTIIDISEALELQRAYLDLHGLETRFVDATQPLNTMVPEGAFLLSDYALSELEPDSIDRYMGIVSGCARGRITCRDIHHDAMVARLQRVFGMVSVEPETPRTSKHANVVIRFERTSQTDGIAPPIVTMVRAATKAAAAFEMAFSDTPWRTRQLMAERLRSCEPFAFSRWGDGEWSAILGKGTKNCDGQAYEPLRDVLRSLLRKRPQYLLGMQTLAMERFGPEITAWLSQYAPDLTWVYADVFHDLSKEGSLVEFVAPLRHRHIVLVGPAYLRALTPILPYSVFVEVPERNAYEALPRICESIENALVDVPDTVVALSAGMSTNWLVHNFHGVQGATLIDFGSVWEPYVGRANRSYHAAILERERGL